MIMGTISRSFVFKTIFYTDLKRFHQYLSGLIDGVLVGPSPPSSRCAIWCGHGDIAHSSSCGSLPDKHLLLNDGDHKAADGEVYGWSSGRPRSVSCAAACMA